MARHGPSLISNWNLSYKLMQREVMISCNLLTGVVLPMGALPRRHGRQSLSVDLEVARQGHVGDLWAIQCE